MSTNKKRKISGIDSKEAAIAYAALTLFKKSIVVVEEGQESDSTTSSFDISQLDGVIKQLEVAMDGQPSLPFSSAGPTDLTKLGIIPDVPRYLKRRPNCEAAVAKTTSLGAGEFWSSEGFIRHLELLQSILPVRNEACARAWVDAFFFRVSAMLQHDERIVLNMEHQFPALSAKRMEASNIEIVGFTDYTVVIGDVDTTELYNKPTILNLKPFVKTGEIQSFFVVEAKYRYVEQYIPQALCEMYASGQHLEQKIIRGCLTNGHHWLFLILKINDNFIGGSYRESDVIGFSSHDLANDDNWRGPLVEYETANTIAAILFHWVRNSFKDLQDDDLLVPRIRKTPKSD